MINHNNGLFFSLKMIYIYIYIYIHIGLLKLDKTTSSIENVHYYHRSSQLPANENVPCVNLWDSRTYGYGRYDSYHNITAWPTGSGKKSIWIQSVPRRTFHSTPRFSLAGSPIDIYTGQERTCPVKNINTSTMAAAQSASSLRASHPYQQSKQYRRNSHV